MNDQESTISELRMENADLKETIAKLTKELSNELTDNIVNTRVINDKNKSLNEVLVRNQDLILHHRMMESRYKAMAENIKEAISIIDTEGIYIYANQKSADLHRLTIPDLVGRSIFEVLSPESASLYRDRIFTPVMGNYKAVTALGSNILDEQTRFYECQAQPVFDDAGRIIGILNVTIDKTEETHQQVFREIEQHVYFLSQVSSGLEDILREIFFRLCQLDYINFGGVYILDEKSKSLELLCHYNLDPGFADAVRIVEAPTPQFQIVAAGVPRYDFLEIHSPEVLEFFHKMGIRSMAVIPLVNGTNVMGCLNLASTAINPFSEARKSFIQRVSWRITSIIGLHKTQEKLKSTVEILNETISDLRVKQQLLIQKSKMESLGELSAGMAHEINQPLVIISLSVENILQKMESTGNELSVGYLNRKFEAIQLNVKRIQQIIENLRIFARDQSGIHFERVSIREAVGKTMAMIGPKVKSESIQMVLEGVNDHHHVLGNIFNLEQVFINILSNSIYAVNEKNKGVQGAEYAKRISITVTMKEDRVFIDFGDNGTGIREEHIEKLFTPFYTTKMEHGTGLGLAIVYGIVKEMNGDIAVTSKVDEFTNVRLSFPSV